MLQDVFTEQVKFLETSYEAKYIPKDLPLVGKVVPKNIWSKKRFNKYC